MDSVLSESVGFNPAPPYFMHIDLNSCFATIEQQANPLLRGKPVAVAAYPTGGGCILAASVEAKRLGVKTGLRVRDGKALCPGLAVLPPDPNKYRFVNRKLLALFKEYSADVEVKSIDEMVINFKHSAVLNIKFKQIKKLSLLNKHNCYIAKLLNCYKKINNSQIINNGTMEQWNNLVKNSVTLAMLEIGKEIKVRIKNEIGEWLTVSIGIAPNRFLAKTASGLRKPDGLDVIAGENIENVLSGMKPEDLCGIKEGNGGRLRRYGIDTALKFYRASIKDLQLAFSSIAGYYWWLRLHGWEADDREFGRKSFGHSYALFKPYKVSDTGLRQIIAQLSEKTGRRLRRAGYAAGGIHMACLYKDYSYWHKGKKLEKSLYAGSDIYKCGLKILGEAPDKLVRNIFISVFSLERHDSRQMNFLEDESRKLALTRSLDKIADRWGEFAVIPGRMLAMESKIHDRIAFGGVKELEEFVFRDKTVYE